MIMMIKRFTTILAALLLLAVVAVSGSGLVIARPVFATAPPTNAPSGVQNQLCQGASGTTTGCSVDSNGNINSDQTLTNEVGNIVGTLLLVAAAVAVLIIVFGGIGYITSIGDAARVKQAKDTILYAVIGLVVVILAYAIVNFVIGRF
jgi:hypothetical protein